MADTAIGFRCIDYVITAAAGTNNFYFIKVTDREDKITELNSHQIVACVGENGPRVNFTQYIKCNLALNRVRQHGREATCHSTANFMRAELASAIRSRGGAYEVNCLLAGYDVPASDGDAHTGRAHLYYLDYLGTLQEVPYAAHGYGSTFVIALLDRLWRPNLTQVQGLELMQKCIDEVKKRVIISTPHFFVKAVTADGVQVVDSVH